MRSIGRGALYAAVAIVCAIFGFGCEARQKSRVDQLIALRLRGIERGTLMITSEELTDRELSEILADRRIVTLQELTLHNNQLTAAAAHAVAKSPKLRALGTLDLSFNPLGDEGVIALARSPLPAPKALSLARVGATSGAVRALAASPYVAAVEELDLRHQELGAEAALLTGKRKVLRLAKTGIGSATAVALLRNAEVGSLDLSENVLRSFAGLDAISPAITGLDLSKANVHDLSDFAKAPAAGLRTLQLAYNPLGDAGLAALASAHWLDELQFLNVIGSGATPAARQALRAAWGNRPGLTLESD